MSKKIIIILIIAVALSIGVYFYVQSKDTTNESNIDSPPSDEALNQVQSAPAMTASQVSPSANDSFPLKVGSKGANVVRLQKALNSYWGAWGKSLNLSEDGILGKKTMAATNVMPKDNYSEITQDYITRIENSTKTRLANNRKAAQGMTGMKVYAKRDLSLKLYEKLNADKTVESESDVKDSGKGSAFLKKDTAVGIVKKDSGTSVFIQSLTNKDIYHIVPKTEVYNN